MVIKFHGYLRSTNDMFLDSKTDTLLIPGGYQFASFSEIPSDYFTNIHHYDLFYIIIISLFTCHSYLCNQLYLCMWHFLFCNSTNVS